MTEYDARNATARKIATIAIGVLKSRKRFSEKRLKLFAD